MSHSAKASFRRRSARSRRTNPAGRRGLNDKESTGIHGDSNGDSNVDFNGDSNRESNGDPNADSNADSNEDSNEDSNGIEVESQKSGPRNGLPQLLKSSSSQSS